MLPVTPTTPVVRFPIVLRVKMTVLPFASVWNPPGLAINGTFAVVVSLLVMVMLKFLGVPRLAFMVAFFSVR